MGLGWGMNRGEKYCFIFFHSEEFHCTKDRMIVRNKIKQRQDSLQFIFHPRFLVVFMANHKNVPFYVGMIRGKQCFVIHQLL